jgi:5'-nucleotidase
VRVLVTNDDGVRAPGIEALAEVACAAGHDVVVVAPLTDYSGAGAAVGPVHSRQGVDYEGYLLPAVPEVPAFGIDGPPALAVILACVGGFGPRPDLVLSGINHGANVGRSVMHSGTVGAALTAAHFGLSSMAVSLRFGPEPAPWSTAATVAGALLPSLTEAPAGTVVNVNVPDVAVDALCGVRYGAIGRSGTIRSAVQTSSPGSSTDSAPHPHVELPPFEGGTLRLDLTPPATTAAPDDRSTDAALVANGFVSLTALVGVRDVGADALTTMIGAVEANLRQ